MPDDRNETDIIIDFIMAFQKARQQVCGDLRRAYRNLHFNSLPKDNTPDQIKRAERLARIASREVIDDIERQIAGYTVSKNSTELYIDGGRNPDGRIVLLNMLDRDGVDKLRNLSADEREKSILQEMRANRFANPDANDMRMYDDYRAIIAKTALGIIRSMKAER